MAKGSSDARRRPPAAANETLYPLDRLLLDANNPRFGSVLGAAREQADILDFIVERFGVDDVLSSIAVNGYFSAEPLVCRHLAGDNRTAVVAEGNRRLAACLILTGDKRAARHRKRTEDFGRIWIDHGKKAVDPVPVILFAAEEGRSLLSYLGVRHIAASQPWDSYAKAAWVARVVEEEGFALNDVARMIGDQHRTITRLLEGYYFIQQAIENGSFRPIDSVRRGRGSVSEYPFSWVYTILGYTTVRKYLEIGDSATKPKPVPARVEGRAGVVVTSMFGDRSKGRNAAISDSRQLGDLASVFADPTKVTMLENGKSVAEIERTSMPIADRLRQGLSQVRDLQAELLSGIAENNILPAVAEPLIDPASKNRRSAQDVERRLKAAVVDDADSDE